MLLDERCRVKPSDFGFTREFEESTLLDTFCGTIGYGSPEMLLVKRISVKLRSINPEFVVGITDWRFRGRHLVSRSYRTVPFDDDGEVIMKEKILRRCRMAFFRCDLTIVRVFYQYSHASSYGGTQPDTVDQS